MLGTRHVTAHEGLRAPAMRSRMSGRAAYWRGSGGPYAGGWNPVVRLQSRVDLRASSGFGVLASGLFESGSGLPSNGVPVLAGPTTTRP